ncbi:MAG: hypothetical protein AAGD96_09805 [Chloroflexota bacterium]
MEGKKGLRFSATILLLSLLLTFITIFYLRSIPLSAQSQYSVHLPAVVQQADFNSFYVSTSGDNSDGLTWETAWNEMDQINWPQIQSGDHIFVDGGSTSMTYATPLIPEASGAEERPIVVMLSGEAGRDGQAIIFGGNDVLLPECGQLTWDDSKHAIAGAAGIHLINEIEHVTIDGRKRGGFQIHGWSETGVKFYPDKIGNGFDVNPQHITLKNMEIYNNGGIERKDDGSVQDLFFPLHSGAGIKLAGMDHIFQYLEIHDNAGDAIQSSFTNPTGGVYNNLDNLTILDSWFYNQRAHSGTDNSPAGEMCGLASQNGCDELGAPQMSIDYHYYPAEYPNRSEMFNWCTHPDGIQIFSSNDFNTLNIERTIIGPNFMNGMVLGDNGDANHTAWVNNLSLQDVVITRFTHNALGMKNPDNRAGKNWNINNVTIYGHYSSTNKDSLTIDSKASGPDHTISNSVMVFGRTKFLGGNVAFENNCEYRMYSGSIGGNEINPRFGLTRDQDFFENDIDADFAQIFVEDYTVYEPTCAQVGSNFGSVSKLLSNFNQE